MKYARKRLCNAAFNSLFLAIDGYVYPCCINQKYKFGNYNNTSLTDIWNSSELDNFRKEILNNEFPIGCESCKNDLLNKQFSNSQIINYDNYIVNGSIKRLDFQISNICNLACDMCTGILSSTVAEQREKNTIKTNNNLFSEDLNYVLANLEEAFFSGGEPFLVKEYFKIWEYLILNNSKCKINIQTNGTVFNQNVKAILEHNKVNISFSIDSFNKDSYEKIRKNAVFSEVKTNFDNVLHLIGNNRLSIAACIMKDNYLDVPEIIEFCQKNNIELFFNKVVLPGKNAIWTLNSIEILKIINYFKSYKFKAKTNIQKNNLIMFTNHIKILEEWKLKSLAFETSKDEIIDHKIISEIQSIIEKKIYQEIENSNCEDKSELNKLYHNFVEILNLMPNTTNKYGSLIIINNYKGNELMSHLYREDNISLKVILNKISMFYSVKK